MKPTIWTGLFRGTATLGIGTILWLQQNYVSREKFEDYKASHAQWADQVVKSIDDKLERINRSQNNIEQELRMLNRNNKDAAMAIPRPAR